MNGLYDPRLVGLSLLVAVLAAFTALDLANSVTASRGRVRGAWCWGGALAMGTGIWGLHFVGTLAASIPATPATHDVWQLTAALALAVLASGLALHVVSRDGVRRGLLAGTAMLFGAAFSGVHLLAVRSIRTPARLEGHAALEAVSLALGLAAGALLMWLAHRYRRDRRKEGAWRRLGGGALVGAAFAAAHYAGMGALHAAPSGTALGVGEQEVLANPGLAFAASGGTLLILAIALTGSSVGRELARRKDLAAENWRLYREAEEELHRRTAAESAQRESERRFRLLVSSVRDYAIVMLDPHGRVVSWNEGAERINGYSREEVLGRHCSLFHTAEDRARGRPDVALAAAERNGAHQEEGWRVRRDGSRLWAQATLTALRDDDGALVGFADVTRDLTERKRAEEERERILARERAARLAAEEANRVKADFLATMSHELRTPLNHILGYADLLLSGTPEPLPEPLRRSVERIEASGRHLLGLIEEILTYGRLDRGEEPIHPAPVDLPGLVRQIAGTFEPAAREKGLTLSHCVPEGTCRVETDPALLGAILHNLLENAVAFTDRGGIEVGLSLDPDAARVRVRDTGIGIDPADAERIFEPFVQVESGTTRTVGGTGMGLALARRSARRLGGDLSVESEPGGGSTFTLSLPGPGHGPPPGGTAPAGRR